MRRSDWRTDGCSPELAGAGRGLAASDAMPGEIADRPHLGRQLVPQQQPLLTACPFDQHHRRRAQRLARMAEVPVATLRLEDMAAGDGRLAATHAGQAGDDALEVGGKPRTLSEDGSASARGRGYRYGYDRGGGGR